LICALSFRGRYFFGRRPRTFIKLLDLLERPVLLAILDDQRRGLRADAGSASSSRADAG
jgi:hypothetical protein